jgi:hypothetical protein
MADGLDQEVGLISELRDCGIVDCQHISSNMENNLSLLCLSRQDFKYNRILPSLHLQNQNPSIRLQFPRPDQKRLMLSEYLPASLAVGRCSNRDRDPNSNHKIQDLECGYVVYTPAHLTSKATFRAPTEIAFRSPLLPSAFSLSK